MGKVEDVGGVVPRGGGVGKKFSAAFGGQKFTPMGRGVQKHFFGQGGTLLIKVGQYSFTGVVILEKMAPQGG